MRTREDMLKEAKELLDIMAEYKVLKVEQLYRVLRHKTPNIQRTIMNRLERSKRIFIENDIAAYMEKWTKYYDRGKIQAFWVLLDFGDDVVFNAASEFPAKLEFITENGAFDVIFAEKGQENMINGFLKRNVDTTLKHLVIVDEEEQMDLFDFPGIACFCIVSEDGQIEYFQC